MIFQSHERNNWSTKDFFHQQSSNFYHESGWSMYLVYKRQEQRYLGQIDHKEDCPWVALNRLHIQILATTVGQVNFPPVFVTWGISNSLNLFSVAHKQSNCHTAKELCCNQDMSNPFYTSLLWKSHPIMEHENSVRFQDDKALTNIFVAIGSFGLSWSMNSRWTCCCWLKQV